MTLPGLRDDVILLINRKIKVLLKIHDVLISHFQLNFPLSFSFRDRGLHFFLIFSQAFLHLLSSLLEGCFRNKCRSGFVVAWLGDSNIQSVHYCINLLGFVFVANPILEKFLTSFGLDIHDTIFSDSAHGNDALANFSFNGRQNSLFLLTKILSFEDIGLVSHNQKWFIGKEGLNGVK